MCSRLSFVTLLGPALRFPRRGWWSAGCILDHGDLLCATREIFRGLSPQRCPQAKSNLSLQSLYAILVCNYLCIQSLYVIFVCNICVCNLCVCNPCMQSLYAIFLCNLSLQSLYAMLVCNLCMRSL